MHADLQGIQEEKARPPAQAYLFSSSGTLLAKQRLDANGNAELKTDYGFGERVRYKVVVGPETDAVHRLRDFRAHTRIIHAEPGAQMELPPFEVAAPDWGCW